MRKYQTLRLSTPRLVSTSALASPASATAVAPKRTISDVALPEPKPELDSIEPAEGRMERLRGRLAKSQGTLGRSMLGLLGGGDLDEDSWQDVEDTLLIADLGPVVTDSVV